MRRKTIRPGRRLAPLLALILALSPAASLDPWQAQAFAAPKASGEDELSGGLAEGIREDIVIKSVDEFLEFCRNCTAESYSKGKMVLLEADLNLQGLEFQPIPVFAGTFEGNGHGVIGLSVHSPGSALGLFRYVQEGAIVRNLRLQGSLIPGGSQTNIGGIAGVNRGTIENCRFDGHITAQEALGGIAGHNEATGVIRGCENQAMVTGNRKSGGIAGFNEGLIENCVNLGEVNTADYEIDGASGTQPGPLGIDLEENLRVERVNDAGGIAGLSLGTIRQCTNQAAIGYPHMGYNLGGIAGRQSGLIDACANYGTIQGRKDTGGIAGQFEPHFTVEYEEDMFGTLEKQMDELSHMSASLSSLIENTGDTASENLDSIDGQLDKIKDVGRFYKNLFKNDGDVLGTQADQSLDEIQWALEHMDLDLVSGGTQSHVRSARETLNKMKALRAQMKGGYEGDWSDIDALRTWLTLRYGQLEQLLSYGDSLQADLDYIATHAPYDVAGGVEDFEDDLERLQIETNTFIDVLRSNRNRIKNHMDTMDEELTRELDVLSWNVDALGDNLRNSKNQLRDQRKQIQDQIQRMQDAISGGAARLREKRDFFEDVSDLETQSLEEGMLYQCSNYGIVSADYQAGGIVGIIGTESGLDPEQDLDAEEERTLNVTRNMKAIVSSCVNRQEIQVKNDYAGGIVGKANLGALIGNQNYGDITAEDGSYAGGITGSSAYILRGNYSMCQVNGKDYTGGIAGWGTDLLSNYAMASFGNPEGEWQGAVAGDVDNEGVVEGNVYVEEGIGAIDGITYEGQAEGLPYETFRNLAQMPVEFSQLTVKFLVEDQVLKSVPCQYGGGVAQKDVPQAPQKDGYYYVWEEKDLSCIRGNEKVHAIYKAWNATIASSDDKTPLMLVEANFYPGASLTAAEKALESPNGQFAIPEGYQAARHYEYSILQPEGAAMPESLVVHVLAQGLPQPSVAGVVENGSVCIVDSRWDGPYLVFEMDAPGEIVILKPENRRGIRIGIGALILALAAGLLLMGKSGKPGKGKKASRHRKHPPGRQTGKP